MNKYIVTIPISGVYTVEVEASDEEEAKRIAWERGFNEKEMDLQWESHQEIVEGSVFCGMQNTIEAEEI